MGVIIVYCREGCPHSIKAAETLNEYKYKYNIKIKYIQNNEESKNAIKDKLKDIIGDYSTFPIVLYKTSKKKILLIGGNSDLQKILNYIQTIQNKNDIKQLNLTLNQKRLLYFMYMHK